MSSAARAALGVVVVLVVVAAVVLALGSPQAARLRTQLTAECRVVVGGEAVPLDREQARAATTRAAASVSERSGPAGEPAASPTDPATDDAPALPDGTVQAIRTARQNTALSCRVDEPDAAMEVLTASGLTPRAQGVRDAVGEAFGDLPQGGFAPGGVDSGHGAESTHYEGRAIDYFFRPVTGDNLDRGWVLAQWLVAHADDLTVQYVIFDDSYWGVQESRRGWQDYRTPAGADEILRHLDHVHVDVVRGEPAT